MENLRTMRRLALRISWAALIVLPAASLTFAAPQQAQLPVPAPASQTSAATAKAPASTPSAPAQQLTLPGLPNLGKVHERLYRGAQPEKPGWDELKKLGVEIVVNLRDEKDKVSSEREAVEKLGLRYVSIPMHPLARPQSQDVAEFLELLRANSDKTIFVHCRRGAERTGVMLAAYRIAEEKWTPEQALAEMKTFHFRSFWFRHLKNYVREFPSLLLIDPHLTTRQTRNGQKLK